MSAIPVLFTAWALAGSGAVLGSILGNSAGQSGLVGGAIAGGIVGVVVAALFVAKMGWIGPRDRVSAIVGGLVGFGIAAPLAVTNLSTPIVPVLACGLTGIIMLLGVGVGRGIRGEPTRDEA